MSTSREVRIVTPLAPDVLHLRHLSGTEALGRPFEFRLELLSDDHDMALKTLLGREMTVEIALPAGGVRELSGVVTDLVYAGAAGRHARFWATMRPWLWLLSNTTNCRIFQNATVPEIVAKVFQTAGFSDFKLDALSGTYAPQEYVVQYRESDFNFVSRLLEREGIYYFFQHKDHKHVLVLADDICAHERPQGYGEIPYFPPDPGAVRERDHLDGWRVAQAIQPGGYALRDYDFQTPDKDLISEHRDPADHPHSGSEIYDYPGDYLSHDQGKQRARIRLEELRCEYEKVTADGNVRGLAPAHLFQAVHPPRACDEREFLVTSAVYDVWGHDLESNETESGEMFRCSLSAIPSDVPFRSPRVTSKPIVPGAQTAVVVGKEHDEICTDELGRIKVQFHWDRDGQNNQESSCWIRVAQIWAGDRWGAQFIPRVGQEVVVEFLDGDPDRPLVTGSVYNGKRKPPFKLPDHATQSGIRSRSSKHGAPENANEIRFEDKKGAEELFVQAERNHRVVVKAAQSIDVGASRSLHVAASETIAVDATRTTTVKGKETATFEDERTVTVLKNDTLEVTERRTETVHGGRHIDVHTVDSLRVHGANRNVVVDGQYNIGAAEHFKVAQGAGDGTQLVMQDGVYFATNGDMRLTTGGCEVKLSHDGKLELTATQTLTLGCGGAAIALKSDGTIEIKGGKIVTVASGNSTIAVEPAAICNSGARLSSNASGIHEITGALVKIN